MTFPVTRAINDTMPAAFSRSAQGNNLNTANSLFSFLDPSYTLGLHSGAIGNTTKGSTGNYTGNSVIAANNQFAMDYYTWLNKDPDYAGKNIFFSPFSISSALAITYEGARGTTADEIQSVFHFPKDDNARRQEFLEVNKGINSDNTGYTLNTANALWAEKTFGLLPSYIQIAENYYHANVENLDFKNNPEGSRSTINQWVGDRTNGKIQDLMPEGSIDQSTRLVITNAIYFKGTWVTQFDKGKTSTADFRLPSGLNAQVQMMQITSGGGNPFNYTETGSYQALEMPYEQGNGNKLSMVVILPKGAGIATVENSINTGSLQAMRNNFVEQPVIVYFPKFRLETEYDMTDMLQSMGMPTAFSTRADFSGMDGEKDLLISGVFHKAYIEVNEEGTEAAAATGVGMTAMGIEINPKPVPVFKADHPFIFMIQDDETGNVLFMGRVENPNG